MRHGAIDVVLALGAVGVLAATVAIVQRSRPGFEVANAPSEPRKIPPNAALAKGGHLLGEASAPIRLIEFSDFQCPFCRTLHQTLKREQERYPGLVAVVYHHYPLPGHAQAVAAAIASECAAQQGSFAKFADLLFEKQDSLGRKLPWETLALRAGILDTARFRACRAAQETRALVQSDLTLGATLHITGTPALVWRDQLITGAVPLDTLERWLRSTSTGTFPDARK